MDNDVYTAEAALEATHWWFIGRRALFRAEIARKTLPDHAQVLDVGCGTGANLRFLKAFPFENVVGLDASPIAQAYCRDKGLGPVLRGDICDLPFEDRSFDLVLATDVLEHIDDDDLAIREVERVLRPGGRAVISVPTFMSLWGFQDIVSQHKRRYTLTEIQEKLERAGLRVDRGYYFNFLLFLPILLARKTMRWLKPKIQSEAEINNSPINWILLQVFSLDVALAGKVRPPFGVSALIVAQRPADAARHHPAPFGPTPLGSFA